MSLLFPKIYNYKECQEGVFLDGIYNTGYSELLEFEGNIQPMTQVEINSLNIGRKNLGKIKIFTDKIFNIAIEESDKNGDLIFYENKNYEIISLDNHTGNLLPHKEYIAELRIDYNLGVEN